MQAGNTVKHMRDSKEERILIQKAAEGDIESFELLILSCKDKAYGIALRYLKNEEDAMDALQESFIKIYKGIANFNFESKFDTWVYRIVVNACSDLYRKNKKNSQVLSMTSAYDEEEDGSEFDIKDKREGPEALNIRKEESGYLLKCLDMLSDEHRTVIILRDIKGFSYEEISEILDCSLGTVKSRVSRARLRLKEIYIDGKNDEEI